jgi:hypothetical protein
VTAPIETPPVGQPKSAREVISERLLGAWMSASAAGMQASPQDFSNKFAEIIERGLVVAGHLSAGPCCSNCEATTFACTACGARLEGN